MFSHRMAPPAYEADTKTDAGYLVGPALIPLVHMPFKKAVIPPMEPTTKCKYYARN